MSDQFWMIWPGNAVASALILFAIAMPFLYAARMGRGRHKHLQGQVRQQRDGSTHTRGDQALGAYDPRQGAGRVPPRLRVAPQDTERLHAVLALARQDLRAGGPEADGAAADLVEDRRADGEI